jgi:hypothetical protein
MNPIRAILVGCIVWCAAVAARADVFVLNSGGQIEGTLVTTPDAPRDKYVIKTDLGGVLTLAKDQVKEIVKRKPAEIEYDKKRHLFPDTVEGQWELAEWCQANHLGEARKTHLRRILELDPNHAGARSALGYSKFDGQWKTQDEVMTERGYVEYKGRWRLPQEIEILEQERKNDLALKGWYANLKRWRDWYDGDRHDEAVRCIREIKDPLAVRALSQLLEKDTDQAVRILAAEALNNCGTSGAVALLSAASLEDESQEVRLSCLDYLTDGKHPETLGYFILKLHDKDNKIVNHAAVALSRMKDQSAIAPLIDALVTNHKFKLVPGGPQGNYSTTFGSNGAGGFSFGGSQPKVVSQDIQNPSVLDALVTLTNANYNYDKTAWKNWLATQRKSKMLDPRRG